MTGSVYRLCRKCGLQWNVSALAPGEKIYLCPYCERRVPHGTKLQ